MPGRLDEEDNSMDAVIHNVHAVNLVLSVEVRIEALLNVLNNWLPRLVIVNEVAETRRVHHGQPQADTVLFDIGADGLYRDSLGDVETWGLGLLRGVQRGVEEGVYKSRFTESGLACKGG